MSQISSSHETQDALFILNSSPQMSELSVTAIQSPAVSKHTSLPPAMWAAAFGTWCQLRQAGGAVQ